MRLGALVVSVVVVVIFNLFASSLVQRGINNENELRSVRVAAVLPPRECSCRGQWSVLVPLVATTRLRCLACDLVMININKHANAPAAAPCTASANAAVDMTSCSVGSFRFDSLGSATVALLAPIGTTASLATVPLAKSRAPWRH